MSFYSDASLVMIPSGYKTSKVYSAVPTSGDGDLVFSRSNDTATRVGPDGLIEKVRTNVILQSETFDNASWAKINITATANSTTAPNGTLTADTILAPLASFSGVYQTISSEGAMTLSVYAKANTSNFIAVTIFDVSPAVDYMAIFDLSNGTFIGNGGFGSVDSYSIENAGNGWYRLSVTKNLGAVGAHNYVIGVAKTGNSSTPVAGTSVFVWGAQVEVSDFGATPYIVTTSAAVSVGPVANVPRLDYLGSSCPRLLLEPQRTNLALYSEQFDNAAWTKSDVTITANATTSPDGYTNADLITASAGTAFKYALATIGATTGDLSVSFFVKQNTAQFVQILMSGISPYANYDLTNKTSQSFSGANSLVQDYGNGWLRLVLIFNAASATDGAFITFTDSLSGARAASVSTTNSFYVWGAQIEGSNSAYATSYIPTLGAAVTRGADSASKTSATALIGQTEGTVFVEFKRVPKGVNYQAVVTLQGASSAYLIEMYFGSANTLLAGVYNSGSQFEAATSALSEGTYKAALAYKTNDFAFYVNGVQISTDNSGTVPALSTYNLGDFNYSAGQPQADGINQALLFTTRLSNADLAALTA